MIYSVIVGIAIHVFLPIAGIVAFVQLVKRMQREAVPEPPILSLFLLFACYGSLLLVVLTTLFWEWSGMASLGVFALAFGAPFVTGYIAMSYSPYKQISVYHAWTFRLAVAFTFLALILAMAMIF